jgi:hypothetical protein
MTDAQTSAAKILRILLRAPRELLFLFSRDSHDGPAVRKSSDYFHRLILIGINGFDVLT